VDEDRTRIEALSQVGYNKQHELVESPDGQMRPRQSLFLPSVQAKIALNLEPEATEAEVKNAIVLYKRQPAAVNQVLQKWRMEGRSVAKILSCNPTSLKLEEFTARKMVANAAKAKEGTAAAQTATEILRFAIEGKNPFDNEQPPDQESSGVLLVDRIEKTNQFGVKETHTREIHNAPITSVTPIATLSDEELGTLEESHE
jgi:hypothetical protein